MDFRHLIVTCLFSKLRLPFDNQKVKENYAILFIKCVDFRNTAYTSDFFMRKKKIAPIINKNKL